MPVCRSFQKRLIAYSAYPNCPNVAGSCPNIHVGEDFPQTELNKINPPQQGNGRITNGHKIPRANGHAPRHENRRANPPTSKPQEQVPLCKFGAGCTKSECPFAHPTPAAGLEGLVLRGEMCPEGRNCLNKEVRSIAIFNGLMSV
jgi:nuclear polyadenylated RNA-binding protein NAB2